MGHDTSAASGAAKLINLNVNCLLRKAKGNYSLVLASCCAFGADSAGSYSVLPRELVALPPIGNARPGIFLLARDHSEPALKIHVIAFPAKPYLVYESLKFL